jgi:hemoglobin
MQDEQQNESDETLYDRIGGETGVRQLVTLFYDEMENLPEADTIRKLHRPDLTEARQKLFEYYSGWFGGPPLYISQYGHPRLRARHMHVPIGVAERDAWLICLVNALKQMNLDDDLLVDLLDKIVPMADHMRNQQEAEKL